VVLGRAWGWQVLGGGRAPGRHLGRSGLRAGVLGNWGLVVPASSWVASLAHVELDTYSVVEVESSIGLAEPEEEEDDLLMWPCNPLSFEPLVLTSSEAIRAFQFGSSEGPKVPPSSSCEGRQSV